LLLGVKPYYIIAEAYYIAAEAYCITAKAYYIVAKAPYLIRQLEVVSIIPMRSTLKRLKKEGSFY
jgi:hypothetical protein